MPTRRMSNDSAAPRSERITGYRAHVSGEDFWSRVRASWEWQVSAQPSRSRRDLRRSAIHTGSSHSTYTGGLSVWVTFRRTEALARAR